MKKHNLLGFLAVVLMALALVFTFSCGGDEEEVVTTGPTGNAGKNITGMVVSKTGSDLTSTASIGTLGTVFNEGKLGNNNAQGAFTEAGAGKIELSAQANTGADIVVTPVASVPLQAVEYAIKAAATDVPADSDFKSLTLESGVYKAAGIDFEDGKYFFLRTTAQNGTFGYYKMLIEVGKNAKLKDIGGINIGGVNASFVGNPKTAWAAYIADDKGMYQADDRQPAAGFKVVFATVDPDAKIWWVRNKNSRGGASTITVGDNAAGSIPANNGELTAYDPTATNEFTFTNGMTDMAIKVISGDMTVTNYYRVTVVTKAWMPIYKGSPDFTKIADALFEDTEWDKAEWIPTEDFRINRAEETPRKGMDDPDTAHTSVRAKLLWDDDGLYALWDVIFKNTTEVPVRKAQKDDSSDPGEISNQMSNAHYYDSVELFVNERYQEYKEGNAGLQYRISCDNIYSGDPADGYEAMALLGRFQAWIVDEDPAGDGGYRVAMQVPWVFAKDADASEVFDTATGKPKPGPNAQIGVELQINVNSEPGVIRDGIITWNGVGSQAYQQVRSYGIATLLEEAAP